MRWIVAVMLASNVTSVAASARAQGVDRVETSSFSVTRGPGAEGCPDTRELTMHIGRVRGEPAKSATGTYHVSFSREDGVFRALIRAGASGVRVLRDRGATCVSLAQATALTLALLLDSDAGGAQIERNEGLDLAPSTPTAPAPPSPLTPAPPPSSTRGGSFSVSAGALVLLGVLDTLSPGMAAELGMGAGRFRAAVGAVWLLPQTHTLGVGSVGQRLLSGSARMCLAPWQQARARFDLCSGIYAGLMEVQADGYTRNDRLGKAWMAIPVEMTLSLATRPLGLELGATALLPLRRNDFVVDNVGVAYHSWPIGGLLALRAVGSWLL